MPSASGEGPETVFQNVRARIPLKLLPSTLTDVAAAIQQELAGMLLRLNPALGGVPVAFSDVKMPETDCAIFEDQPQLHVNVVCNFVLFAPKVGQHLTGVVNNIAEDSVGLLMLDTFNATIPYEELATEFAYEEKKNCWKRTNGKGESIAVGQVLDFRCTGIKSADTVVQVIGAPVVGESSGRKPKGGEEGEGQGADKKEKKEKKSKRKTVEPDHIAPTEGGGEESAKSAKKKKKSKKDKE